MPYGGEADLRLRARLWRFARKKRNAAAAEASATLGVMSRYAAAIPDATWRAIESRDRGADGRFVYGVTSTRDSAARRVPRAGRAATGDAFFRAVADAEAAGFRACLRCHPTSVLGASATDRGIERARRLIDAHVDADRDGRLTLAALSAACGISPFHLQRAFSADGRAPRRRLTPTNGGPRPCARASSKESP